MVRAHHTIIWTGQDLSYREQFKDGDEEADRGNDGKATSMSGLALNGIYYCGKPRTARSGGSWLQNLQWCPDGQPDHGIDKIGKEKTRSKVRQLGSLREIPSVRLTCTKRSTSLPLSKPRLPAYVKRTSSAVPYPRVRDVGRDLPLALRYFTGD